MTSASSIFIFGAGIPEITAASRKEVHSFTENQGKLRLPAEIIETIFLHSSEPSEFALVSSEFHRITKSGISRAKWLFQHIYKLTGSLDICRIHTKSQNSLQAVDSTCSSQNSKISGSFPSKIFNDEATCCAVIRIIGSRHSFSDSPVVRYGLNHYRQKLFIAIWDFVTKRGFNEAVRLVVSMDSSLFNSWIDFGLSNCLKKGHYELSKFLLDHQQNGPQNCGPKSILYHHGRGRLNDACESGNVNIVELLLERERCTLASLNEALEIAAEKGHKGVIKCLIENGACTEYVFEGMTKFTASGDQTMIEFFLSFGISREIKNACLCVAAEQGHIRLIRILIEANADVNAHEDEPLRLAVRGNFVQAAEYLISHGADIHADDDKPLRIACEMNHILLVESLIANGANVHAANGEALSKSLALGHLEVVKLLLKNDADLGKVHRHLLKINSHKIENILQTIKPVSVNSMPGSTATSTCNRKRKMLVSLPLPLRSRSRKTPKSLAGQNVGDLQPLSIQIRESVVLSSPQSVDNLTLAMQNLDLSLRFRTQ